MDTININFNTWLDLSIIVPSCIKNKNGTPKIFIVNEKLIITWYITTISGVPKGIICYVVKSDKSYCGYYSDGIDLVNDQPSSHFTLNIDGNFYGQIASGLPFNSGSATNGIFEFELPSNYFINGGFVKLLKPYLGLVSGICVSSNSSNAIAFNGPYKTGLGNAGPISYLVQLGGPGAGYYGFLQYLNFNITSMDIDAWLGTNVNLTGNLQSIFNIDQSTIVERNGRKYLVINGAIYNFSIGQSYIPGSNGQSMVCYDGITVPPMPYPYPTCSYDFSGYNLLQIPAAMGNNANVNYVDNNTVFCVSTSAYIFVYSNMFAISILGASQNLVLNPTTTCIKDGYVFNISNQGVISSDTGNNINYIPNVYFPNNPDFFSGPSIKDNRVLDSNYLINNSRPVSPLGKFIS